MMQLYDACFSRISTLLPTVVTFYAVAILQGSGDGGGDGFVTIVLAADANVKSGSFELNTCGATGGKGPTSVGECVSANDGQ
jgi:NAD(P)H-hydrate repair Nnr-like enzyme with NAD(P)H-hydrate epimerase domain